MPENNKPDTLKIVPDFDYTLLDKYSFFIIGFPVYHFTQSTSMRLFLEKIPVFKEQKKAFLYVTFAMLPGNAIRDAYKILEKKNVMLCGHECFRGPASDMALFGEYPYLRKYSKKTRQKLDNAINNICSSSVKQIKSPIYRWYMPLANLINSSTKKSYRKFPQKFHVIKEECINCHLCVKDCPWNCWDTKDEIPVITNPDKCEICLRCIHNCPKKAITANDKDMKLERLDKQFYNLWKKKILQTEK